MFIVLVSGEVLRDLMSIGIARGVRVDVVIAVDF